MMTFIPAYTRANRRAMISQAFEPKTLMGLGGMGCACSGGAPSSVMMDLTGLKGLGTDPVTYDAVLNYLKSTKSPTSLPAVDQCWSDPAAWSNVIGSDGSCMAVCTKDKTKSYPLDPAFCSASGVPSAPVNTAAPRTTGNPQCDDPANWGTGMATNGKCYTYCTADPTDYFEVGMDNCMKAAGSGGSGSLKITPNLLIIGAVAIGAIILLQQ